jgi:hypothetical protein
MSNRTAGGWVKFTGDNGGRVLFGSIGGTETYLGFNRTPTMAVHIQQTNAAVGIQGRGISGESIGYRFYTSGDTLAGGLFQDSDNGRLHLGVNGRTNAIDITYGPNAAIIMSATAVLNKIETTDGLDYRELHFATGDGSTTLGYIRQYDASGDIELGTQSRTNALRIAYGTGNVTAGRGSVTSTTGFAVGSQPGISPTLDVLVAGGTTNRLVWVGGILASNIDNFYSP